MRNGSRTPCHVVVRPYSCKATDVILAKLIPQSMVHLLPLGNIQLDRLQDYLGRLQPHFDRILGFRPTGWSYSPPAGTDLLPDVNTVIRRDQARGFTDAGLKPMRGSCRQYMMYGEQQPCLQTKRSD